MPPCGYIKTKQSKEIKGKTKYSSKFILITLLSMDKIKKEVKIMTSYTKFSLNYK